MIPKPLKIAGIVLLIVVIAGGRWLVMRNREVSFEDDVVSLGPDQSFPPIITPVDTSSWKTYKDREYGFEFKYPADLRVEKSSNSMKKKYEKASTIQVGKGLQFLNIGVMLSPTTNLPTHCEEQQAHLVSEMTIAGTSTQICRFDEPDDRTSAILLRSVPDGAYVYNFWCWFPGNYGGMCSQILSTFRFTN